MRGEHGVVVPMAQPSQLWLRGILATRDSERVGAAAPGEEVAGAVRGVTAPAGKDGAPVRGIERPPGFGVIGITTEKGDRRPWYL